jgi:hypothetical protein
MFEKEIMNRVASRHEVFTLKNRPNIIGDGERCLVA